MMGWSPTKKLIEYDNSILLLLPFKAGEDNPQAREEGGKLSFIKKGVQCINSWKFPESGDWNSMGKPLLSWVYPLALVVHTYVCFLIQMREKWGNKFNIARAGNEKADLLVCTPLPFGLKSNLFTKFIDCNDMYTWKVCWELQRFYHGLQLPVV